MSSVLLTAPAAAAASRRSPRLRAGRVLLVPAALLFFSLCFYRNAWIVDEAYVFFRTIENFLDGYGLRWNVDERVQAYTSPLWLFLMIPVRLLIENYFYGAILLSFVLCLAGFYLFGRALPHGGKWKLAVFVLLCATAKTVMDFTTSGLENPLLYFLEALFLVLFLGSGGAAAKGPAAWAGPLLIASLCFTARQDSVLLFLPALVYLGVRHFGSIVAHRLLFVAALTPIVAWSLFSLVYYGFLFPNTAYAKLWCTGLEAARAIEYGRIYLGWTLAVDWPLLALVLISVVRVAYRRRLPELLLFLGAIAYTVYLLLGAAGSTHMGGKLLSVPLFLGLAVAAYSMRRALEGAVVVLALVVFTIASTSAPVKAGTRWYRNVERHSNLYIDTKEHVRAEGPALINWRKFPYMPHHPWYEEGILFRHGSKKVTQRPTIGYFGFAAGPEKHVIDYLGLGDPLLARLPLSGSDLARAHPGHFQRTVPAGYERSLQLNENRIRNDALRRYYDLLYSITRAPLFSRQRLVDWVTLQRRYGRCYEGPAGIAGGSP